VIPPEGRSACPIGRTFRIGMLYTYFP
jgi:hypothetical protein